ncbi:hypothetical protein BVRB_9g208560 isoform B [Beta vulgaris subsp. vulgaris]|nr:hypothetical protein BVRB_9g208560 isoform B [Beta vulgaris subsp. vulgaris]
MCGTCNVLQSVEFSPKITAHLKSKDASKRKDFNLLMHQYPSLDTGDDGG